MYILFVGSTELAAVGVSASVFNLVSKLFNVPLLNITTSFVAEEQALVSTNEKNIVQTNIGNYLLSSVYIYIYFQFYIVLNEVMYYFYFTI